MAKKLVVNAKKKFTQFRPQIRSRHPSHESLRVELPLFPFRSVIRLGSQTELGDEVSNGGARIEINTPEACQNSADKKRMKNCFTVGKVKTADWFLYNSRTTNFNKVVGEDVVVREDFKFPIVAKHRFGSRGRGNTLINNQEELTRWMRNKDMGDYIFETFHNYNREYRLHVTESGCFYTCRKMLREDTPEANRWYRNDSNSVWIVETNPQFDRPVNWKKIEEECVKALKSCGLDFGACDVRVQSTTDSKGKPRKDPEFIIIEINSAPSFGEITLDKYLETIPVLLYKKYNSVRKNKNSNS